MSDLFGNHIVGFPTRRLMYCHSFVSSVFVGLGCLWLTGPGPEVIKPFSCSTQLRIKF